MYIYNLRVACVYGSVAIETGKSTPLCRLSAEWSIQSTQTHNYIHTYILWGMENQSSWRLDKMSWTSAGAKPYWYLHACTWWWVSVPPSMVGLPCARGSNQPQRRGRSGCGCCIGWNPNKTRMKCGLHSRKTIFEHPPLSEQEIYTQCFHGRLDRRRVYIMFVHVYATFIHVLPILRSNNQCHGLYVFFHM